MSRVIKFRAWDTKPNIVYGVKRGAMGMVYFTLNELDKGYLVHGKSYIDGKTVLMQFTGLKDKNGVEIYEGDIIRLIIGSNGTTTRGDVQWEDESAQFIVAHPSGYHGAFGLTRRIVNACEYEVIGNIYENPELLKVGGDV